MNPNAEQALLDHLQPARNIRGWIALPACIGAILAVAAPFFTAQVPSLPFLCILSFLSIPVMLHMSAHQQDRAKVELDRLRKTGRLEAALEDFRSAAGIPYVGRFGSRYFFAYHKPFIVSYGQIRSVTYDTVDIDTPEKSVILLTKNGDRIPLYTMPRDSGAGGNTVRQIKSHLQGKCPVELPF